MNLIKCMAIIQGYKRIYLAGLRLGHRVEVAAQEHKGRLGRRCGAITATAAPCWGAGAGAVFPGLVTAFRVDEEAGLPAQALLNAIGCLGDLHAGSQALKPLGSCSKSAKKLLGTCPEAAGNSSDPALENLWGTHFCMVNPDTFGTAPVFFELRHSRCRP